MPQKLPKRHPKRHQKLKKQKTCEFIEQKVRPNSKTISDSEIVFASLFTHNNSSLDSHHYNKKLGNLKMFISLVEYNSQFWILNSAHYIVNFVFCL